MNVTIPPVTIPSFPCLFTGLSVKDLGYCTFYDPSFGIFSSKLWREWSIMSNTNLRIFCLNLPSSYPAWNFNGEMITGMITPTLNEKMYFPNGIGKIIRKDWIIDGSDITEIFQAFKIKSKLFLEKLKEDFELFIYIIRVPDCITHHPKYRLKRTQDIIKEGYKRIDNFLGKILNSINFDNLFIISDHGLKIYQYEFNIKRFLEKEKVLFYNNDKISKFMSIFVKIFGFFNRTLFDTTFFHNNFKTFLTKLKAKINPSGSQNKKINSLNKSRFIHFYSNYGGLYLSEYDKKFKKKIKIISKKCKYIEDVIEFDSKTLPDLIFCLKSNYLYSVKSSFFLKNRFNSFNHSDKGIFIAYGKNIIHGHSNETDYLDFIPTLLKLYEIPIPAHMRGRILKIINK